MTSVATSKSNPTKACKALITAQGKIHAQLFDPIDSSLPSYGTLLDARKLLLVHHLAELRSASEVLSQRRKEFIDVSKDLASDESPDVYFKQSGIDDIVIQAETIMATVASHLQELEKLAIEPFYGDITQFHKFWYSFELAVHNDQTIDPDHKYLYLHSLLKGEAQIVLQDLRPQRPDYHQVVELLHKRYNRPYKIRATLHKRLQQLPQSRGSGSELRNTWFRITGILQGLREYEDFKMVLPPLDLVKSKFPMDIRQKLHDVEFQSGSDFDLDQVMFQLDRIISSREKYEDSCTLGESCAVQVTTRWRSPSRSRSPSNVNRDDKQ
ncbi:hypothetical protein Q1695_012331 [Nippostrongylus brasiliensis]|nr:hypothetical protein Q1695_012331 [Nippostrongylus brasiliensis]